MRAVEDQRPCLWGVKRDVARLEMLACPTFLKRGEGFDPAAPPEGLVRKG